MVALPSLIVWGLGFPFTLFLLFNRQRHRLADLSIRDAYGFLFRGYKSDYYFWELTIFYRKVILIFICIFISTFGAITQALIVFLVQISFLLLNFRKKPHINEALFDLETLSIFTSTLTVYCGLFFIADAEILTDEGNRILNENSRTFFFAVIILSNGIFFIYWLYKVLSVLKQLILSECPRTYLLFCACMNKEKLYVDT